MNYINFYSKLREIYIKYKTIKEMSSNFNVFNIISNASDENMHSDVIAGLLKDSKYGKIFFKFLLDKIGIQVKSNDIDNINVEREKYTGNGRIDIYISFEINNETHYVVIENKIYADDQIQQLNRYYEYCVNLKNSNNIYVVYLTLYGDQPSDESCNKLKKKDIILISYKNEIADWLKLCLKEVSLEPSIREVIEQYMELIIELTGGKTDLTMEIKDIILDNIDNYIIAEQVTNALIEAKAELELRFWNTLELAIKEDLDIEYTEAGKNNPKYSIDLIRNHLTPNTRNQWFGLMFPVKENGSISDIYLKVEVDGGNLYYGIRKQVDNNFDENSDKIVRLKEALKENNFKNVDDNDYWMGWKNFEYNGEYINLKYLSKDVATILMNTEELEKLIDSFILQIRELVDIIISNHTHG